MKKPAQPRELGVVRAGKPRACSAPTKFYKIQEVAEMLALSPRTIRRAIDHGRLIAHRFGGAVRIAERDFLAFIAINREA
jgi:excisionase family DNA binding protein